jgi:hypothetical protein
VYSRLSISCSDTEQGLEYFYEQCVIAGPLECAVYEKTPSAVKDRVDKIFNTLLHQPIPTVIGTGPLDYGLVDYRIALREVFGFLYHPFAFSGRDVSLLLASLEKGDGSLVLQTQVNEQALLQCSCGEDNTANIGDIGTIGSAAIAFSDAGAINDTVPELQAWYEANRRESMFADIWPHRVIGA